MRNVQLLQRGTTVVASDMSRRGLQRRARGFPRLLLLGAVSSALCLGLLPTSASAALIAALDFQYSGSDWTVTTVDGGFPITYGLGGDPTKAGLGTSDPGAVTAHYRLTQVISAPAGYTMSDVQLKGELSGRADGYYTDARVGLDSDGLGSPVPFACDYNFSNYYQGGGSPFVNEPFTLDSTANPQFDDVTSVYIAVEMYKSIASGGYWAQVDVSALEVHATLTAVPEPASLTVIGLAGLLLASRRRA